MPNPTISSLSSTSAAPTAGTAIGAGATGGRAPTGSVLDTFSGLIEMSWKNVQLPVIEFETEIGQDLVPHRFADRNGAYIEGTGRKPTKISATLMFSNYIRPAGQETWIPGGLYPYQWRLFLMACLEGTSGVFMHPELGPLNCKLDMARTTWSGRMQGGVVVHAAWIESDDTQADQIGDDLSSASPTAGLEITAADLDTNMAAVEAAVAAQQNPFPPVEFTFAQLANSIIGVFDTTTILAKESQGRCDNMVFQAQRVEDSVSRSPILGPLAWPIIQGCERSKDMAYQLKAQAAIAARPQKQKALPKDMTMGQAAAFVGENPTDFIVLNYQLVQKPVIPQGTIVTYFADAA
jgi:hypothetical protein